MYLLQAHFDCLVCLWLFFKKKALVEVQAAGVAVTLALVKGETEKVSFQRI